MQDDRKLEEELASFRREWREEIRRTVTEGGSSRNSPTCTTESPSQQSREGSPLLLTTKNSVNTAQTLEEKVLNICIFIVSRQSVFITRQSLFGLKLRPLTQVKHES